MNKLPANKLLQHLEQQQLYRSSKSLNATGLVQNTTTVLQRLSPAIIHQNSDPSGLPQLEHDENEYAPSDVIELTPTEEQWILYSKAGLLVKMIRLLSQVKIDCSDSWGSTALMHACNHTHIEVVKWLLEKFADINKQDYRGITCLMEASWNNHLEMVKLLLDAGADVNKMDRRCYTALMQAAEEGHTDVVQLLIRAGADLNKHEHKRSYTALMWAVIEGHPGVVQLLVQSGADVNMQDKYGLNLIPSLLCNLLYSI